MDETTISACRSSSRICSNRTARPWSLAASSAARSKFRWATKTAWTPSLCRCRAANSAISPAPRIRTRRPYSSPKIVLAKPMAAEGTDTGDCPIPVSVRTFFATPKARVIRVFSTGPVAAWALATW